LIDKNGDTEVPTMFVSRVVKEAGKEGIIVLLLQTVVHMDCNSLAVAETVMEVNWVKDCKRVCVIVAEAEKKGEVDIVTTLLLVLGEEVILVEGQFSIVPLIVNVDTEVIDKIGPCERDVVRQGDGLAVKKE